MSMNELLKVCHLSVSFPDDDPYDGIEERDTVIRDLSFSMEKGDILGVVGESGSGKSMTALSVIRLLKKTARIDSGEILFQGKDHARCGGRSGDRRFRSASYVREVHL